MPKPNQSEARRLLKAMSLKIAELQNEISSMESKKMSFKKEEKLICF